MAHAAAIADLPLAANCIDAAPGDPATVTRVRWGGSLLEEARAARRDEAAHRRPARRRGGSRPRAPAQTTVESSRPRCATPTWSRASSSGRRPTPAAASRWPTPRSVVSGGRGAGSAEGFAAIEELAELARRRGRLLARGHDRRLAAAHRPGRPDRHQDRARDLHPLRDQRRDPAHGRLQGREAHPRDQHRPRRADRSRTPTTP